MDLLEFGQPDLHTVVRLAKLMEVGSRTALHLFSTFLVLFVDRFCVGVHRFQNDELGEEKHCFVFVSRTHMIDLIQLHQEMVEQTIQAKKVSFKGVFVRKLWCRRFRSFM